MTSTVVVHMASGARHAVQLPTDQAGALHDELTRAWTMTGPAHTLHFADGTSVTVNPRFVEAVELR